MRPARIGVKRYRAPRHRASFVVWIPAKRAARLIDISETVYTLLWEYHQCCRPPSQPYPFSFEVTAHNVRYAILYENIVLDACHRARQECYPFTIDWFAVQLCKDSQYRLTFALREIRFNELAHPA